MTDLPVKKICANCSLNFTTVDAAQRVCKFCRSADDDLRIRLGPPLAAPARTAEARRYDLWTAEREAALRKAVAQKLTGGQITDILNAQFGLRLSRNAVIGKCGRLGIRLAGKSKGGAGLVTTTGKRNAPPLLAKPAPPRPLPVAPAPLTAEDIAELRTLLTLPGGACRWPLAGEGKMTQFCGQEQAADDAPYCAWHMLRAVSKSEIREAAP